LGRAGRRRPRGACRARGPHAGPGGLPRRTNPQSVICRALRRARVAFAYRHYLVFLFVSLGISIGLQMVLPFPYGLGVALAIFIVFPLLLRRRYMGQLRGGGGSGSGFGGGLFGMNRETESAKFSCMRCGKVYKGRTCPVCGSSATSAHF